MLPARFARSSFTLQPVEGGRRDTGGKGYGELKAALHRPRATVCRLCSALPEKRAETSAAQPAVGVQDRGNGRRLPRRHG